MQFFGLLGKLPLMAQGVFQSPHSRVRRRVLRAGAGLVLWLSACCPEVRSNDAGGAVGDGAGSTGASFASIQRDILDGHCVKSCHDIGMPSAGLRLSKGLSHGELFDRPSQQLPSMKRVAAGDPQRSYLLRKMTGGSGVVGERMPRLAGPRPSGELARIEAWIAAGAAND